MSGGAYEDTGGAGQMPGRGMNDQALLDTAVRIEERREPQHRRTILWVFLLEVAILAIMVAVALGAWVEQRNLLERVEAQNDAQLLAIEENRQAAMRSDAAFDRVLVSIGDRIVPKAEVRQLQRSTERLRRTVVVLSAQVAALNQALRRAGLESAGGG